MKNRYLTLGLCLSAIVVALEIILFLFNRSAHFASENEMLLRLIGAAIIVVGLWVQSSVVRFGGGIFLAITGFSSLWAVITAGRANWVWGLFLCYALVGLAGAYLLLISRGFSAEFRQLKEKRST
jgi:hypothetical protein